MSFNAKNSLSQFYEAMGKPTNVFKQHVDTKFLPELHKPFIRGGANKSQRIKVVQEAVDAMQSYGALDARDAAAKRMAFETSYRGVFKGGLPPNSPSASVQSAKMKLIDAKYNIFMDKFKLLDYWSAVAEGYAEPELPADGKHWNTHFLLNYEPTKVRPILQVLLNDASEILEKRTFTPDMSTWVGADTTVKKEFNSTNISKTIKFAASARAGVQGDASLRIDYQGLKGELNASLFAGARAKAGAEVSIKPGSLNVSGNVEVEIGLVITGDAHFDIGDILEIDAEAELLAGAQLKASGKIVVSYDGVEVDLGAEAFAGLRIKGKASGALKLGGRNIAKGEVEGSAWAGAGASGKIGFKCGVFGDVTFNMKAGAAIGVGAEAGFKVSVDLQNIKWGTMNLMWIYAAEHGIKNQGRAFLLPVEENIVMCNKARDSMFQMMAALYQENEAELAMLQRWDMIKSQMINGRKVGV